MTPPPPAATAAPRAGLRRPGSRIPRRVSGPAGRPAAARAAAGALALPRGLEIPRVSPRALLASAAWHLRSVLGGRGLIAVLAGMLLGLVFLQVSLLKLNTQISENVERAHDLERGNAALRTTISRLDAGQRIQDVAGRLGMVMPGPGSVCYLDARRGGPCSGGDPLAAASAATTVPEQPGATATQTPQTTTPAQTPQSAAPTAQTQPAQEQPIQPQTSTPTAPQAQPTPVQQPAAPQQTAAPTPQAQPTGGIVAGAAQ